MMASNLEIIDFRFDDQVEMLTLFSEDEESTDLKKSGGLKMFLKPVYVFLMQWFQAMVSLKMATKEGHVT